MFYKNLNALSFLFTYSNCYTWKNLIKIKKMYNFKNQNSNYLKSTNLIQIKFGKTHNVNTIKKSQLKKN